MPVLSNKLDELSTATGTDDLIYTASGGREPFATYRRNIMKWLVPEVGTIEMYVNPQSINIANQKLIKDDRTKGGFVLQYWGEQLTTIRINGTTGTAGIEGINILEDIYRGEQRAFNVLAINEQAQLQEDSISSWIETIFPAMSDITDVFSGLGENESSTAFVVPKPSLAYYAFTLEMYYHGVSYRGYISDFSFSETADQAGWFNYDLTFKATLIKGRRSNFMPWHRNPKPGGNFTPSSADYNSTMSFDTPSDQNYYYLNPSQQTYLRG